MLVWALIHATDIHRRLMDMHCMSLDVYGLDPSHVAPPTCPAPIAPITSYLPL